MSIDREMATSFFNRRDAIVAIAAGTTLAVVLNVWYNLVAAPATIDGYLWLARIHEPAGASAERLAHALYPKIGYPWCVRLAVAYGYAILVGMWALAVFVAVKISRLMISVRHRP